MRLNRLGLGACASLAVAAAIAGSVPATAGAAFGANQDSTCERTASITGGGASFARNAQLAWGAEILAPSAGGPLASGFGYAFGGSLCAPFRVGGGATVRYSPNGSGAGRAAFGATDTANQRHTGAVVTAFGAPVNFGGVDEAPTSGQLTNANNGAAGTSDDARLQTIPIAQSSIAIVVRLPSGCTVAENSTDRSITRTLAEAAFRGDASADTWGEVLPSISPSGSCDNIAINRVVRYDNSGTTFQFKRYLGAVPGGLGSGWFEPTLANADWPNRSSATSKVITSNRINGAGAQLDTLNGTTTGLDQSGSSVSVTSGIAYADLATARAKGFNWGGAGDDRFWVYVQRIADNAYSTPTAGGAGGNTSGSARGANCTTAVYGEPDGLGGIQLPADTSVSWYDVDSTRTDAGYPICALTYALAWQDPVPVNTGLGRTELTELEQRSTIDRLWYTLGTGTSCGQTLLAADDYAALPSGAGSVLAAARAGVQSLDWTLPTRTAVAPTTC